MAEINYLPICLTTALHLGYWYPLFRLRFRSSYNHLRDHRRRLSQIHHAGSPWWCWLALTHHLAPHSQQVCRFFIQDILLRTVLVQWSHLQVKFEEFQRATGTEHSSLSLINLTLQELKDRLWRHSAFACDSRYRTHISPYFLRNLPNQ